MQDYNPPSMNYIQQAVDNGEQTANNNDVSTVQISILATDGNTTSMRTNVRQAHTPAPLGSLARVFILVKAVMEDKSLINENRDNTVISMMGDYSKQATDDLWAKYGGPKIINDLAKRYDLQETITGSNWDNTYSSAVDVTRLINRFLKDPKISDNQKEWTKAMLSSTSLNVEGQDFGYGVPFARGITSDQKGSGGGQGQKNSVGWIQGAPMNSDNGLYKHTVGIITNEGTTYIVVIMATFPDGTGDAEANDKMNKIAMDTASQENLDSNR